MVCLASSIVYAATPDVDIWSDLQQEVVVHRTLTVDGAASTEIGLKVQDAILQSVNWSSSNNSIMTAYGDSSGVTISPIGEGTALLKLQAITNIDTFNKSAIISVRSLLNPALDGYINSNAILRRGADENAWERGIAPTNLGVKVLATCGNYYQIQPPDSFNYTEDNLDSRTSYVLKTKVNINVSSIELNKKTMTMIAPQTVPLYATVSPSIATNKTLTWKSSNTNVAVVDQSGKVKAVGNGTSTITATSVNGITATCNITAKATLLNSGYSIIFDK